MSALPGIGPGPAGRPDAGPPPAAGTIGILAGLGPLAGAHFYRRLVEATPAADDAGHLGVVLLSDPTIPSRVEHLLGAGPSPEAALVRLARTLQRAGASAIAIPSSTTHAYHRQIQDGVTVPVINLLSEVAAAITRAGSRTPALLVTTATARLGLYQPHLAVGVQARYPDPECQQQVQDLVAAVKSGGRVGDLAARLQELADRPWADGADAIVLGCTELCLFEFTGTRLPVLSATEVLVEAVLRVHSEGLRS